jgi:DNA polymerase III subunit gamma/tau
MGQTLYRKYRSKKLSEVLGQEHITTTLEHALKTGKLSHAYLFTGPHGVGKTSIARILAHEINQLPYTDDSMHLDIIEIDAASNRRIDEIRELRDKVNIAPTSAKYKVYIIDEVHMLTKEAFNALLKTLEEPPAHVVFILATTDAHKLPETIISRTQRYTFKPVPLDKVVEHLRMIAGKEGIDITDEALQLIAAHGEGSFRDSISLLDQAGGHDGKIDEEHIQTLLGIPPLESVQQLAAALSGHDAAATVVTMEHLHEQGFQPAQIAKHLGAVWRKNMLQAGHASPMDFQLLQKLLDVPAAANPERYLEIVLLEFALSGSDAPVVMAAPQVVVAAPAAKQPGPSIKAPSKKPAEPKTEKPVKSEVAAQQKTAAAKIAPAPAAHLDETVWPEVLAALKKKHNTLYGIVRMATPRFGDGELGLEFSFAFHKKQVSEAKNQKVICDVVEQLTGEPVAISCSLVKRKPEASAAAAELVVETHFQPESEPTAPEKPDISSISNIFGGAELLES